MKNLPGNKFFLAGAAVAVVVAALLLSGALKFNFSVEKSGSPEGSSQDQSQETKFGRPMKFGGTGGKPEFSINPPQGWSKGDINGQADLAIGSLTPEKLPSGTSFTVNIIASISPHPISAGSIADYQASWKEYMLNRFPSMEVVGDRTASVGGMDAYVLEMKQTRDDGVLVHQLQYVFYINKKYALGVTGSAPEDSWDKYKDVIKASLESVEKVSSGAEEEGSTEELTVYTNPALRITTMYPADWKVKEEIKNGIVSFTSPSAGKQVVNVLSKKLPSGAEVLSLDDYTNLNVAQLEEKGAKFSQQAKTTLAGLSAYKVVYRTPTDLEFMQVWTVKNSREYIVSYAAQTSKDYEALLPTAQKVISSFEIR